MTCAELPTKSGAVVHWSTYYDGPNYHAATLTHDRIYAKEPNGDLVWELDPEWPEGYEEGEEPEQIYKELYEGLCWQITGERYPMTPDAFADRHRIDHDWWERYSPERMPPRDQKYNVTVLFEGYDPK